MAWIHNGPVSVPPTPVVGFVAFLIGVTAIGAVTMGVRASWRDVSKPAAGDIDTQSSSQAIGAQPIVELPQPLQKTPVAANTIAAATNSAAKVADDSEDIAAKAAAAQAVQSKPSQTGGNIDDILTSSTEKPQAPAKPSTDEAPPQAPPKSDVPF
ncbi:MAG TPA: hypothetical protein VGI95_09380 [Caulobacteraceae bacterium]|jgi:hypothetical protein